MKESKSKYLLTTIIPMYNSAEYVYHTLNVVVQSFGKYRDQIQVILVDDGSTDETKEIAQEFCTKYSNFQLILQKHKGVSAARNLGIAYAKGDYEMDFSSKVSKIGNFCADAGLVAVFLLNEVRKYNPDIDEWIASHNWCVTTIPDFDGEVNYYVDKQDNAHIVGIGNINFFTTQTSL